MPFPLDFYVSVIDNYGDMGFALNLALSFHAKHPDVRIRFFSNNPTIFQKISANTPVDFIEYADLERLPEFTPAPLIFSFFDRPIPKEYLARFPFDKTIVQFGYFLLHSGVESLHGTEYVLNGHDRVIHCVPSLLPGTGGVIINPEIEARKIELSKLSKTEARRKFLSHLFPEATVHEKKWISVFVYQETFEQILTAFPH